MHGPPSQIRKVNKAIGESGTVDGWRIRSILAASRGLRLCGVGTPYVRVVRPCSTDIQDIKHRSLPSFNHTHNIVHARRYMAHSQLRSHRCFDDSCSSIRSICLRSERMSELIFCTVSHKLPSGSSPASTQSGACLPSASSLAHRYRPACRTYGCQSNPALPRKRPWAGPSR
jgi:hypothetical protein